MHRRAPARSSLLRRALPILLASLLLALGAEARAQSWLWEIPRGVEPGLRPPGYVPGEVLVQTRGHADRASLEPLAREEGLQLEEIVTSDGLARMRVPAGTTVSAAVDRLVRRADVLYAAPNLYARGFFVPNDTTIAEFDLAWNLRSVDAFDAWDVVTGDPKVVLAIVDSGVASEDREIPAYERPFLAPLTQSYRRSPELPGPFVPGWDFVHDDAHPDDDNGHGTFIATVAAGAANNVAGSAGIAFGVALLPVKVLDYRLDAQTDDIVQGIRFAADRGADIINLSLGYPPIGLLRVLGVPEKDIAHAFKPLRDAVVYAQRRGAIVVGAAGNFGAPEVSLPAGYPGVIAVGASGVDGALSSYSSFGRDLDFVAPGGDFADLNGDHVQDATFALSIKPHRSEGSLARPDSFNVFPLFGTSCAAPHVAGAAALLMSLGLREQGAIEQTLRATAVSPFAESPGLDFRYGHGRIQVGKAVRNPVPAGPAAARAPGDGIGSRLDSSNPTRGSAALSFRMERAGSARVQVFDVRGALVRTLADGVSPAGVHQVTWDGRDARGRPSPGGIYFLRVETPDGTSKHKIAFLR